MKRSEMVSKIAAVIYNFNEPHSYVDRKKCLEIAEIILQVQEENGMVDRINDDTEFEKLRQAIDDFFDELGREEDEEK